MPNFYLCRLMGHGQAKAITLTVPSLSVCNRIWRTSHRYSEWLSLKERLRADFGARNLPNDKMFPQKEDVVRLLFVGGLLLFVWRASY